MIKRDMTKKLKDMACKFSVLAILGPRQSGKTTLVKDVFKKHKYVLLEDLDVVEMAESDPRGFLEMYHNKEGIIFDEIQNVPSLLSYIKTYVDEYKKPGYFVLTGSQNFLLNQAISQTLAGRISLFTLLPLSINEMEKAKRLPEKIEKAIFWGCYPRIYDEGLEPTDWYPDYIKTYLERDVRQIKNVTNLTTFQRFVKLCAGRIGQLVNFTSLGNDCGISTSTAKEWFTVLEASYIMFSLQPHYRNFSKRLVKSPKIYFYDTGLACSLLGIKTSEQVDSHYLRGGLFESYMLSDLMKQFYNKKMEPPMYFWRDKMGHEVDCIIQDGQDLTPVEIKAGKTVTQSYFTGLDYWNSISGSDPKSSYVIYAGDQLQKRSNGTVIGWKKLPKYFK